MGETNGDNKKKTAREIIENYNGPKVRICLLYTSDAADE